MVTPMAGLALQAQSNLFELTSHLAAAYTAFEQQHAASQDKLSEAAALEQDIAKQKQCLAQVALESHADNTEVWPSTSCRVLLLQSSVGMRQHSPQAAGSA